MSDRATGVARATAVIVAGTAAGKVLGFGRDVALASVFGAGPQLDAYLVAQSLPNVAVGLTSSAVVTAAVPTLAGLVSRGERERAHRVFGTLLVSVSTALVLVAGGLALAARPLVSALAPGFEAAQLDLAVDLTRLLLAATVFVSATNLIVALLHAHRRFLWASLVAVPFNLALIVAAVGFGGEHGVASLAVGFVIGSVLRVVILVPDLRRVGVRTGLRPLLADERVRSILVLTPPLLAVHLMSNINSFADRFVGSQEEPGTISALNLAYRFLQLPHTLLAMALVQALYPALGAAADGDDDEAFGRLLTRGLGVLVVVLLPLAVGAVVLRVPLVELVYGRGNFSAEDVRLTSLAVAGYAIGIVALGLRELVNRGLFAQGDTRTPTAIAAVAMAVNVVGDLTLGRTFGVLGLALATTGAFVTALVLSLVVVERRHRIVGAGGCSPPRPGPSPPPPPVERWPPWSTAPWPCPSRAPCLVWSAWRWRWPPPVWSTWRVCGCWPRPRQTKPPACCAGWSAAAERPQPTAPGRTACAGHCGRGGCRPGSVAAGAVPVSHRRRPGLILPGR